MSYSVNSLKWGYIGDYIGDCYRPMRRDTGSVDNGSDTSDSLALGTRHTRHVAYPSRGMPVDGPSTSNCRSRHMRVLDLAVRLKDPRSIAAF